MADVVKPKDAREAIASNESLVVDVRPEAEWVDGAERIPGSTHIPAEEIESRLDELPEGKVIFVVCPDGRRSGEVAEQVGGSGRDVRTLAGGVERWKGDRMLTQPSADPDPPKGDDEAPHEEPGG